MKWHFASEEEVRAAAARRWPAPVSVDIRKTGNDVYRAASGTVRRGDEVVEVAGEYLKLVTNADPPWVYEVVDAVVHLPGGFCEALKPGTPVAVLPENYLELLNGHRDDEARDTDPGDREEPR